MPELEAKQKQKQALVAQAAAEVIQPQASVKVVRLASESAAALLVEAEASIERTDAAGGSLWALNVEDDLGKPR